MLENILNTEPALNKKKYNATVNEVEISVTDPKQTGKSILIEAGIKNYDCVDLFQIISKANFEKISLEEPVDLSKSGSEIFITKPAEYLKYTINNDPELTDKKSLTADEIIINAGLDPKKHFLILLKADGGKESFARRGDSIVKITCPPLKFITESNDTICDIEEYCNNGTIPIIAYKYVIKINTQKFIVDEKEMTGKQILSLINQTPETYYLRFKHKNGSTLVGADDVIDFTTCGVERFSAKAKNCTEGRVDKRDFSLPLEDQNFLKKNNITFDCISDSGHWVILRDFPIPEGYNVDKCDIAIMIPSSYPTSALDMFYIFPALSRTDSQPIGALSPHNLESKQYQRWSRHRTGENPWIPGEDNLETHIELMKHSISDEFKKR